MHGINPGLAVPLCSEVPGDSTPVSTWTYSHGIIFQEIPVPPYYNKVSVIWQRNSRIFPVGSRLPCCRLSREPSRAAGSPVPLPCGGTILPPHRGHKTGTVPLLWASARNGPGTPSASSEITAECMELCDAHLKPYSLSNAKAPGKPQMLPGELTQSLCGALAAAWHIHSMGRPSAAAMAHSLVNGWIRSVPTLACPSERCTVPSRTRTMPSVGLASDCPEACP